MIDNHSEKRGESKQTFPDLETNVEKPKDKPHPSSLWFKSRTLSEDGKVYHVELKEGFNYKQS